MINWEQKLEKFLATWEHMDDTIGILVCGSYITGNPTSHSDLDVHIVLDGHAKYRERGNRIVDGLLIEYFANPPNQIRAYFKEDYKDRSPSSQTQFITGKIILDKTGEVQKLKEEAIEMLNKNYDDIPVKSSELTKYGLWDRLDDLQDAYELNRADFDFLYFNCLDNLLSEYMRYIKRPYHMKTILGNITCETVRNKYLLKELPDDNISNLIFECITNPDKGVRIECYEKLTNIVLDMMGKFNVDGFKFKSDIDV